MATSHVARTLGLFTIAALLAVLPGCFKLKQTWKVEKSGKGTAVMKVVVDDAKTKELQTMFAEMKAMMEEMGGAGGMGGMGGMPPMGEIPDVTKKLDPAELKKIAKASKHVRVVSSTSKTDAEKKVTTHDVKFEFDSLQAFFESGVPMGMDVTLKKLESGNYELTMKVGMGEASKGMLDSPEGRAQAEMGMGMMQSYLGGLEMGTSLTLPTAIVETNGKKAGENEVTWATTFDNMMKTMKDGQRVVFKGEGLDWKPFTITPASMEKARKKALEDAKKEAEKAAQPVTPSE